MSKLKSYKDMVIVAILANVTLFALIALVVSFADDTADEAKEQKVEVVDYYDCSQKHKDMAYFAIKHYVVNNLKAPESYERVNYAVTLNSARQCYNVVLQYRAKNSFGAYVTEQVTGHVAIDSQGETTVLDCAVIE